MTSLVSFVGFYSYTPMVLNDGTVQGGQTWHGQLSCKKSSVYVLLTPSKELGGDLFWLGLVLASLVTVRDL
jgi:hypothetical protein